MRKNLVSGIKPTGRLHLGNYFGAMRQFLDLQERYNSKIFIADYHALTSIQDGQKMSDNILEIATDYLGVGLDPKKTTLFKQSDTPAVTELAWILNCLTTMPYLMRAHAFKDAEAKNKEINVGVFDYPILMAADILLSNADVVPVGKDQQQHVEMARDLAEKFNRTFGETFKLPKAIILDDVATVPGIDGQKMSKSYNNVIPLFAEDQEIEKVVMSIKTDSKTPDEPKNPDDVIIYQIHKLLLDEKIKNGADTEIINSLRKEYETGIGYKDAKAKLLLDLKDFIQPIRERRNKFIKNPSKVRKIISKGGKKIRKEQEKKMKEVRKKVGLDM